MVDQSMSTRSLLNLQLSYRGSERQAPSALSLALTLSAIMKDKNDAGLHDPKWTTQQRLASVIADFHDMPGTLTKWRLDEDREKAVYNLLVGTTPESRSLLSSHLDYHKWSQCAFTSDLLKSSRWLLGACPRNVKAHLKQLLTVEAKSQRLFLANVISTFVHQSKKLKPTTRAKVRPSQSEWDNLMNYTCVMEGVLKEAKALFCEDKDHHKLMQIKHNLRTSFMSRRAWV